MHRPWILLLIGLIICAECGAGESSQEEGIPTNPIEVEVGQGLEFTLDSNRTTGYQWELAEPLNESILKLVGSEYEAPEGGRVGQGGRELWTFDAVGTGKTTISLKYIRPWEKGVPPVKSKVYSVTVR
jgi:inhibitor of cysteine peptidase